MEMNDLLKLVHNAEQFKRRYYEIVKETGIMIDTTREGLLTFAPFDEAETEDFLSDCDHMGAFLVSNLCEGKPANCLIIYDVLLKMDATFANREEVSNG